MAEYVKITERSTTIVDKGASITTVEHLLAALYGMGVDNALMEINGPEVPIIDGSAKPFVDGHSYQQALLNRKPNGSIIRYGKKLNIRDEDKGIEIVAYPDDEFLC